MSLEAILETGCTQLGITLTKEALSSFRAYYDSLMETNAVMNLTAITGENEVATLHFLDSLCLIKETDLSNARVIDIGSGAGFPGLPIKIAEPSVNLTMLDSQKKRVNFLLDVCAKTGVSAECLQGRAEEKAMLPGYREYFDVTVSRAVARLNLLCELCLPFVRVGGLFIAMKSVNCREELAESEKAINLLGGKIEKCGEYCIPTTDTPRVNILIRKVAPTPKGYPRRYAKMRNSPL